MTAACAGAAAVIHLAGLPGEAPGSRSPTSTSTAPTRSSRRPAGAGASRVIFASSNHAVGLHAPRRRSRCPTTRSPRPTPTTASPRWPGEALAALYHYRYGLDAICLRILTCCDRPRDARALSTWLSPDDAGRLFEACLTAPSPGFRVAFGVSANTRGGWVSLAEARALGYEPRDDAEVYAAEVIAATGGPPDPEHDPVLAHLGGRQFCLPRVRRGPARHDRPRLAARLAGGESRRALARRRRAAGRPDRVRHQRAVPAADAPAVGPDVTSQHLIVTELRTSTGGVGTGFSWAVRAGGAGHPAPWSTPTAARPRSACPPSPEAAWDQLLAGAARVRRRHHHAGHGRRSTSRLWDLRGEGGRAGPARPASAASATRSRSTPAGSTGTCPWPSWPSRTAEQVAAGHTRFKMKVGLPDLDADLERVAAVPARHRPRRAADGRRQPALGPARRPARGRAPWRRSTSTGWRSRCRPRTSAATPTLRRSIDIPVAAGESLYTEAQFRELLLAGAIDFIQPNVCRVGGITPFLRIARLARAVQRPGHAAPAARHLRPARDVACRCRPFVEDIDEASFAALGALAGPSGVQITGDALTRHPAAGHGFTFATDTMQPDPA